MTDFSTLPLSPALQPGLDALGYTTLTPVQAQSLPAILDGRDVIAQAPTGSGKTAAFGLGLLQAIDPSLIRVQALVLCPTRELADQVGKQIRKLATGIPNLKLLLLVGGVPLGPQLASLEGHDPHVVVGTPGRVQELARKRALNLGAVRTLVLDEADRMLDMGFIPQVRQIIRQTPPKSERQTLLFSATFTDDVMNLAQQWTTNPAIVEIEPENVASDTVEQHVFAVAGSDKYKLLYNLITQNDWTRVMVFANRKDEVRRIEERLTRDGISAAQMSGDVPQHKRIRTLEGFREGKIRVLVATDVAGRGIHVDGISHVINFTLPEDPDDYVHRIGRTGRAGTSGTSISFAGEDDSFALPPIEALIGRKIQCEMPPAELLAPVPHSR